MPQSLGNTSPNIFGLNWLRYNEELMNVGQNGLFHPVIIQHGIIMAAAKIRNNLLFFLIYVIKFTLNSSI